MFKRQLLSRAAVGTHLTNSVSWSRPASPPNAASWDKTAAPKHLVGTIQLKHFAGRVLDLHMTFGNRQDARLVGVEYLPLFIVGPPKDLVALMERRGHLL